MTTKIAAHVGSVPSSTGTGAGSASNATPPPVAPLPPATGSPVTVGVASKKGLRLRIQEMLTGFQTSIPTGATVPAIPIGGPPVSQSAVVAQLKSYLDSYAAVDTATLALQSARPAVTALEKPAAAMLAELKSSLEALFGPTSPQLLLFGLKPKGVRRQLTAQQLTARVARSNNTRVIRGTVGKAKKALLASGPIAVTTAPAAQPVAPAGSAVASPPGSAGK
jgi:hypothetical protein